jgi:pyridinium-3,5-bisthiocarboxylic acid mononucleotide nickel chelatase
MIETNIDDASPQVLGYTLEKLLEAGALDVTMTPVLMKKSRPGTLLSVMASPDKTEQLAAILFSETTTLGVRTYAVERRVLARQFQEVETRYGRVRVKYTETGSFAPEYDDCRRLASEKSVPLRVVMAAANELFRKQQNS